MCQVTISLQLNKFVLNGSFSDVLVAATFQREFKKCNSVSPLVAWICSNNHDKAFPQVFHQYRLRLTLGLASLATVKSERTFNKLKLIETHLRTSMRQERLSAPSVLSFEREELDNINLEFTAKNYVKKNYQTSMLAEHCYFL